MADCSPQWPWGPLPRSEPCYPADQDGDKQLSLPEFISLPVGTVENQRGQDVDDSWVRDRRKEFEELIDANHDGIVTMAELEVGMGVLGSWGCPVGVPVARGPPARWSCARKAEFGWFLMAGHSVT